MQTRPNIAIFQEKQCLSSLLHKQNTFILAALKLRKINVFRIGISQTCFSTCFGAYSCCQGHLYPWFLDIVLQTFPLPLQGRK